MLKSGQTWSPLLFRKTLLLLSVFFFVRHATAGCLLLRKDESIHRVRFVCHLNMPTNNNTEQGLVHSCYCALDSCLHNRQRTQLWKKAIAPAGHRFPEIRQCALPWCQAFCCFGVSRYFTFVTPSRQLDRGQICITADSRDHHYVKEDGVCLRPVNNILFSIFVFPPFVLDNLIHRVVNCRVLLIVPYSPTRGLNFLLFCRYLCCFIDCSR